MGKEQPITSNASRITNYPKVSIIILNWNGLEDTIECLESLKKVIYRNYEVIVVDNASKGNDAQVLREKFGDYVYLIENEKNYGYTGGNNIGIRHATSNSSPDYFLLLNNDTVVAPDFLTEMVKVAESDPHIGLVGPKVFCYDFPSHFQSAGEKINMQKGEAVHIGIKQIDTGQYDIQREVDYLIGCCILVKNWVTEKIGLFDESYFCYWDETDYCFRVGEAGYKVVYTPHAKIWHKWHPMLQPWYKRLGRKKRGTRPPYYTYYITRNNFKFMKKHATRRQYHSFLVYFFGYRFWFTSGVCLIYHRDIRELLAFYRGVRDGLSDSANAAKLYTKD